MFARVPLSSSLVDFFLFSSLLNSFSVWFSLFVQLDKNIRRAIPFPAFYWLSKIKCTVLWIQLKLFKSQLVVGTRCLYTKPSDKHFPISNWFIITLRVWLKYRSTIEQNCVTANLEKKLQAQRKTRNEKKASGILQECLFCPLMASKPTWLNL